MHRSKRIIAKRTLAGIMGLMMLVIVLFSSFYVAAEADHDCTGEDCQVCVILHQCENILRRAGEAAAVLSAAVLPVLFTILAVLCLAAAVLQETPVSQKVRMNN